MQIAEKNLYKALAERYALPFIDLESIILPAAPDKLISRRVAEKYLCFPIDKNDRGIRVALTDPLNIELIAELEFATHCAVEPCIAAESDIRRAIEENYGPQAAWRESADSITRDLKENTVKIDPSVAAIRRETESAPVVKMVNLIIDTAIQNGASDIHIEPHENSLHVRNRIDGMLLDMMDMPGWMQHPLTSRIKILANMDIAEKRTPQDGRIKRMADGEEIDLRVSTLPTHHGEKTVIRLLRHNATLLQLESLGLDGQDLEAIIELINKPQGMLFVTGPTGSGKSSTIFACLNRIKNKAINITTIEDPIEYKLAGINQVQINEKAGLTFADTLRSILRQDPDVILLGETRDPETAQIALQSSQTGHLVFSTLHTNDSVAAITRLRDLGIPSFLIASAVLGLLAQRLVRVICPECKAPYKPTTAVEYRYKLLTKGLPFPDSFHGTGCKKCHHTGFKGRTGVFEFLKIDNELRGMIAKNEPEHMIREKALRNNMKKLMAHGLEKVKSGVTSVEELLRVVLVE
jgi:type IV pilus assembly protein PilB